MCVSRVHSTVGDLILCVKLALDLSVESDTVRLKKTQRLLKSDSTIPQTLMAHCVPNVGISLDGQLQHARACREASFWLIYFPPLCGSWFCVRPPSGRLVHPPTVRFRISSLTLTLDSHNRQAATSWLCVHHLVQEMPEQHATLLQFVEGPLARVLAEMEFCGMPVDVAQLKQDMQLVETYMQRLSTSAHEMAGRVFDLAVRKAMTGCPLFPSNLIALGGAVEDGISLFLCFLS